MEGRRGCGVEKMCVSDGSRRWKVVLLFTFALWFCRERQNKKLDFKILNKKLPRSLNGRKVIHVMYFLLLSLLPHNRSTHLSHTHRHYKELSLSLIPHQQPSHSHSLLHTTSNVCL